MNTIGSTQRLQSSVVGSDRQYLCSRQFGLGAPLQLLIQHVVRLRAKAKVSRVATPPVVACMQDVLALRDWANKQNVGNAMRQKRSVPFSGKRAITVSHLVSGPVPATRRFGDALKKLYLYKLFVFHSPMTNRGRNSSIIAQFLSKRYA